MNLNEEGGREDVGRVEKEESKRSKLCMKRI